MLIGPGVLILEINIKFLFRILIDFLNGKEAANNVKVIIRGRIQVFVLN
jgi:hypothetical protein